MLGREELIRSREFWVGLVYLNLWNANGSIEKDSDKWEAAADKVVDELFMKIIEELHDTIPKVIRVKCPNCFQGVLDYGTYKEDCSVCKGKGYLTN
jgi:hypothetical protein